jgi:hypothetical protein
VVSGNVAIEWGRGDGLAVSGEWKCGYRVCRGDGLTVSGEWKCGYGVGEGRWTGSEW